MLRARIGVLLTAFAFFVGLSVFGGVTFAHNPHGNCTHYTAPNPDQIVGTSGSDTCNGLDNGPADMYGRGGNDNFLGLGGNDYIDVEGGNDQGAGQGGSDTIRGNSGNDDLRGGDGNDDVRDNAGNFDADRMCGNGGTDFLSVNDGDTQDIIYWTYPTDDSFDVDNPNYEIVYQGCPL